MTFRGNDEPEPSIDILQAASHPDPYPGYRQLLAGPDPLRDPVHGLWIVTRGATILQALQHPDLRVRPPDEPVPRALVGSPVGELFQHLVRQNDGPARHDSPKASLQRALGAMPLDDAARRTAAVMAASLDLDDWHLEVPVRSVADLLGFPAAEHAAVSGWVRDVVAAFAPGGDLTAGSAAARTLMDRFDGLVARASEGLVARVAAEPWEDGAALRANLAGLLVQTFEATAALLGNTVVALARGDDGADLPALVDRVMRLDAPVQNTRRFAAAPLRLGEADLPQGAAVLLVLGAAGHDPAFDAERNPLGFGWGPHACPGAALARTIVVAALGERRRHRGGWPTTWRYKPLVNARLPLFAAKGQW